MNNSFRKILFKHGYSLIIAAWLFTISFVISNYWAFNSSPQKVQQNIEKYLTQKEELFEQLVNNESNLNALLSHNTDKNALQINPKELGIFVYEKQDSASDKEIYWNTFNMAIQDDNLSKIDGYYPIHGINGFFELLKRTVVLQNHTFSVIGLIPIKWEYSVEYKDLHNSFANSSSLDDSYYIDETGQGYPIYNSKGNLVFKIGKYAENPDAHPNPVSVVFKLLAVSFFLIFLNSCINEITIEKGFYAGAFWLLIIVVLLRCITYWLPFPFNYRSYELFTPLIYASNFLHSSLGDLLINTLLFFWITFFIKYRHKEVQRNQYTFFNKYKKIRGVISLIMFSTFTIYLVGIICSLITDSKIPINVTDFFHLNIYTLVTFIILAFITQSYFNLSYFLLLPAHRAGIDLLWRIIIQCASGLIVISIWHNPVLISIQLLSLIWLIVYNLILQFRKKDLSKPLVNSPYFLFWLMFFAASITLVIQVTNNKDIKEKKRYAEMLGLQADNGGENLLKMAISNFNNSFWTLNFDRMKDPHDNYFIKDSLTMQNFSGFLNKYRSQLFTYDGNKLPLFNKDSTSFDALNSVIGSKCTPTNIPGLYVYGTDNKKLNYIYRQKIINQINDSILGYLFVVVNYRKFANSNLSLELLTNNSFLQEDLSKKYSYAIYKNRILVNNSNDYEFSDSLSLNQIPKIDYYENINSNTKELWYNAGNNTVVVISEKNSTIISSITLFAYLFSFFVLFVVLMKILGFVIQSRFKWEIIKKSLKFNIRFQIHATIIFISIFSFIIIGISTISFFTMRFDKSNQEKLMQSIQILANEIEAGLNTELPLILKTPNDLDNFYNSSFVAQRVIELADLNKQDVNLYDRFGTLQASSQPYIFNGNIVSNKMEPNAYYQMHYKHRIKFLQLEYIDKFHYLSVYTPLYGKDKNVFAYLNVPYLNSQNELNQEISSFLVTVINLNALIFLLAGAIAGLLTFRITKSFSIIKEDMRKINLGIENEEISWNRNDEIGGLVNEYNIMVRKLNESAKALAQSEREGAWKEMARQVAHEIKNPLTPMKLSLQFLQRASDKGEADIKLLSKKVAAMLIEQIDQLARIAGDFSQFADIHNTKLEKFDVAEVIRTIVSLNQTNEHTQIRFQAAEVETMIFADKMQINRLFTNLVKNAIEASYEDQVITIDITETRLQDMVLITLKDNGCGISKDQASKIFSPNFTTKSAGTGLGLAICKGIVEKASGKIWFDSMKGFGTTFYVRFPIAT